MAAEIDKSNNSFHPYLVTNKTNFNLIAIAKLLLPRDSFALDVRTHNDILRKLITSI